MDKQALLNTIKAGDRVTFWAPNGLRIDPKTGRTVQERKSVVGIAVRYLIQAQRGVVVVSLSKRGTLYTVTADNLISVNPKK